MTEIADNRCIPTTCWKLCFVGSRTLVVCMFSFPVISVLSSVIFIDIKFFEVSLLLIPTSLTSWIKRVFPPCWCYCCPTWHGTTPSRERRPPRIDILPLSFLFRHFRNSENEIETLRDTRGSDAQQEILATESKNYSPSVLGLRWNTEKDFSWINQKLFSNVFIHLLNSFQ